MNEQVDAGFKKCPQCGAVVFADMDTCYGCLYRFKDRSGFGGPGILPAFPGAHEVQDLASRSCQGEPAGGDRVEGISGFPDQMPATHGHPWVSRLGPEALDDSFGAGDVESGPSVISSCPQRQAEPLDRAALAVYDRWCEEEPEYVEACCQPQMDDAMSGEAIQVRQPADCSWGFGLAVSAPGIEFRIPVPKEGIWFGSSPESDIILNSKLVPGKAAKVIPYATGLCVVPENSTSTVFRDGIDMRAPFQIHKSDIFYISNIRIRAF